MNYNQKHIEDFVKPILRNCGRSMRGSLEPFQILKCYAGIADFSLQGTGINEILNILTSNEIFFFGDVKITRVARLDKGQLLTNGTSVKIYDFITKTFIDTPLMFPDNMPNCFVNPVPYTQLGKWFDAASASDINEIIKSGSPMGLYNQSRGDSFVYQTNDYKHEIELKEVLIKSIQDFGGHDNTGCFTNIYMSGYLINAY